MLDILKRLELFKIQIQILNKLKDKKMLQAFK